MSIKIFWFLVQMGQRQSFLAFKLFHEKSFMEYVLDILFCPFVIEVKHTWQVPSQPRKRLSQSDTCTILQNSFHCTNTVFCHNTVAWLNRFWKGSFLRISQNWNSKIFDGPRESYVTWRHSNSTFVQFNLKVTSNNKAYWM